MPRLLVLVTVLAAPLLVGCGSRSSDDEAAAPATQCELCHAEADFAFKETKHAAEGHTCQTCHGRSARHSWSEDGHVPPERPLKARRRADRFCNTCHKKAKHPPALDIDRKCSACHAPHPKPKETAAAPRIGEHLPDEI